MYQPTRIYTIGGITTTRPRKYGDYYDLTFAEKGFGNCDFELDLKLFKVSLTDFICAIVMDKLEHDSNPSNILTRHYLASSKDRESLIFMRDCLSYRYLSVTLSIYKDDSVHMCKWFIKVPKIYDNETIDKAYLIKQLNDHIDKFRSYKTSCYGKKVGDVYTLEFINIETWLHERVKRFKSQIAAVWLADTDASPDKKGFMYSLPIDVANMIVGYI